MWFRNLLIYRFTQDIALVAEALEAALATKPARPCESQELTTYGFAAPLGKGPNAPLVHAVEGMLLIRARKEERILPGSVVRDALKEKVDEIEETQMRKVFKKERDQLKDEIVQAFLPRAFTRNASTYAAIDPAAGLIYVDATSPKRAEDLLSTLRECLGSLQIRPVSVKIAPTATLTDWLKQQKAAEGFFVLDECDLRDTHEDGGSIAAKHQDLTSEDLLTDQAEQDGGDDALSQQSASFFLMMRTFRDFVPELLTALGGEETPQGLVEDQSPDFEGSEDDPLYSDAVAFVRESQRASISAVQRKLMIGYNRAARMIEEMERQGIVTPMDSSGSREVIQ